MMWPYQNWKEVRTEVWKNDLINVGWEETGGLDLMRSGDEEES